MGPKTLSRRHNLASGPHQDTHYYGRVRTGTLVTMAGPAPGHHYYGRVRTGTLITMVGTDTPFGLYKFPRGVRKTACSTMQASVLTLHKSDNIVSQACAQKVFHYAFCMYTLSAHFANVLMMQGIYHKPGTSTIRTGHTSNFPVYGEHARTC